MFQCIRRLKPLPAAAAAAAAAAVPGGTDGTNCGMSDASRDAADTT